MKLKIGSLQWISRAEHKRLAALILVALTALVAGVLLVVRIVRLPAPPPRPPRPAAAATLNLARPGANQADQILADEAELRDPTPLFLPTPRNASQLDADAGSRREPGETLPLIEPHLLFSDTTFDIAFPDPYPGPERPADVPAYGITHTPYAPFGRLDPPLKPLPPRMAQVEIVETKTGRTLLALPLPPPPSGAQPPAPAAADWNPLEFLVAIDAAGLIGAPALAQSSGVPAVDDFFSNYLVNNLRIGQRRELGVGFYLVRVGP